MKLADLVSTMARATGYDEGRVGSYARYGREAGLFPTGARGLAAAEVEPEHAFDLLLALTISDMASASPQRVRDFLAILAEADQNLAPNFSEARWIDRTLGRFAPRFGALFGGCDARAAWGNLLRAEIQRDAISEFSADHRSRHILVSLFWPMPAVHFRFRDEQTKVVSGDRFADHLVAFGGQVRVGDPKLQRLRGEYSATFHTADLLEIAKGFRDA